MSLYSAPDGPYSCKSPEKFHELIFWGFFIWIFVSLEKFAWIGILCKIQSHFYNRIWKLLYWKFSSVLPVYSLVHCAIRKSCCPYFSLERKFNRCSTTKCLQLWMLRNVSLKNKLNSLRIRGTIRLCKYAIYFNPFDVRDDRIDASQGCANTERGSL